MDTYLTSVYKQFQYYKQLGEKAIYQVEDEKLFYEPDDESNSIAVIVKHLWGNMLSRWTDFKTSDGEKEWRNRDNEFVNDVNTRKELLNKWEEGWECLFNALKSLQENELNSIVYIRNEGHSVVEAINRQLAHYSYHVGQIVYLARLLRSNNWNSLSIPKGKSSIYNSMKFSKDKQLKHFTDEFLNKPDNIDNTQQ